MNENKLLLSQFLQLTLDLERDPTPENEAAITEWLGKLVITDYLPIKQKAMVLVRALFAAQDEMDAPGAAVQMEMAKVAYGLLAYCVNLENDVFYLTTTWGAYDSLHTYGLIRTIKNVCNEDYQALCSMIDNSLNIGHVQQLVDTIALLNDTEYEKWISAMQQFKEALTPEVLNGLIAMGVSNDPAVRDVSSFIASDVIREAANKRAAGELRQQKAQEMDTAPGEDPGL